MGRCAELMSSPSVGVGDGAKVVMDRRAGSLSVLAPSLPEGGKPGIIRAQPPRGARGHGISGGFGLVGEVSVSELRVVPVGIEEGIRPVGGDQIRFGDGRG